MSRTKETVTIEGANLGFLNFKGKEGPFNREGQRNFAVFLDEDVAVDLAKKGWNIKRTKERDEEGVGNEPYLNVECEYNKGRPPRVVMITSRGRTDLDADSIEVLDYVEFENVDLIINPYDWEVSGNSGRKAYLKSLYATIVEDELERKYADVPREHQPVSTSSSYEGDEPPWHDD